MRGGFLPKGGGIEGVTASVNRDENRRREPHSLNKIMEEKIGRSCKGSVTSRRDYLGRAELSKNLRKKS